MWKQKCAENLSIEHICFFFFWGGVFRHRTFFASWWATTQRFHPFQEPPKAKQLLATMLGGQLFFNNIRKTYLFRHVVSPFTIRVGPGINWIYLASPRMPVTNRQKNAPKNGWYVSKNRGKTPPKWMVYFMEKPLSKWMILGGFYHPYFRKHLRMYIYIMSSWWSW